MRRSSQNIISLVVAVSVASACQNNDQPKVPLTPPRAANAGLTGVAKAALDSGNVLFRSHAYDQALSQYERASTLAPTEAAPLLGVLMVADVKRDAKLRESAAARLRQLDPALADSTVVSPHSKIMQSHPKVAPPASG